MTALETGVPGFSLRYAQVEDIPLILRFIRQLAEYDGEPQEVKATEELLCQSLFDQRAAEVLIAEERDIPVGFAIFHGTFSPYLGLPGIHLMDLFIEPGSRGKGFGRAILGYLARLAVERGCGRLEWWCHTYNQTAMQIYRKWGAQALDDLMIFRLAGDGLIQFAQEPLIS